MEALHALIVTYQPGGSTGAGLEELCGSLLNQGVSVEILDNASTHGTDTLARCAAAGAEVTRLTENVGVAGGLAYAVDRFADHEWILVFDQDSVIGPSFVADLTSDLPALPRAAVVAPVVLDQATGRALQGDPAAKAPYPTDLAITSGALFRIRAVQAAGPVRSGLFMDWADFDICLRVRRVGWDVVIQPRATLRHSVGQMKTHRLPGGLRVTSSHHSADRQYYRYRNVLYLLREGTLRHEPRLAARTVLALVIAPAKIVLVETDRRAKFRAIADGIRDGLRGQLGTRTSVSRLWRARP